MAKGGSLLRAVLVEDVEQNGEMLEFAGGLAMAAELIATLTDKDEFAIAVTERSQGTPGNDVIGGTNAFFTQHQSSKVHISTHLKSID
jgi:hypothetical protein